MNKRLYFIFISLLSTLYLSAQEVEPIVFTLNGKPTYKSEVLRAYNKNNENAEIKLSKQDFLQAYIKLKMNVEEARFQQLDTVSRYVNEYAAYKSLIAKPYLTDTVTEKIYVRKMYDRLVENVELNHFLIPFEKEFILPSDTLAVYEKAMEVRRKILKSGFKEDIIAIENVTQNMYLGPEGKNGYLGWITPFILSPKLEEAIYNVPLKEISMPIRTANGYHIIQTLDKRPATGSAEIEQIMFRFTEIPASQHQIDSVRLVAEREYKKIKSADDFQFLCEAFSDAYKTGDKGCYFGMVGLDSNLSPEFLSAVFGLENPGDISKPAMSDYGFHIIRLLKRIPVPDYESIKSQLLSKIKNSNRIYDLNKEKRARLFSNLHLDINNAAYGEINDIAATLSPRDSLFTTHIKNEDETLVTIEGGRKVPVREFARYIKYRQNLLKRNEDDIEMMTVSEVMPYNLSTDILREYFSSFLNILALDHIEQTLGDRYPKARDILNEFSDGLLFFEVKNKNVWERSKTDEAGLASYFADNKKKYSLEQPKYKGMILYAKDEKSLKESAEIARKEKSPENAVQAIREKLNKESVLVKIEPGLWKKGDNEYVDNKIYRGKEPVPYKDYPYFTVVGKKITKPEDYKDVKAAVELDYQEKLENEWDSYLKGKYKVEISETVLESLK